MRSTFAVLALTAGLATGGVALAVPGIATAANSATGATSTATHSPDATITERAAARVTAIRGALAGLVSDGTINQAQADKVAATLSTSDALRGGGHGGHGRGGRGGHAGRVSPETVAGVLGISVKELRTQLRAGQTLAQIADAEGIARAELITTLVAAAKTQLTADVTAGRITQEQADAKAATLTAGITARVDKVTPTRGERRAAPGTSPTA